MLGTAVRSVAFTKGSTSWPYLGDDSLLVVESVNPTRYLCNLVILENGF